MFPPHRLREQQWSERLPQQPPDLPSPLSCLCSGEERGWHRCHVPGSGWALAVALLGHVGLKQVGASEGSCSWGAVAAAHRGWGAMMTLR